MIPADNSTVDSSSEDDAEIPATGGVSPETAARDIVEYLSRTGQQLSLAESCTGGWVSQAVTTIPGASECFWGAVVSYANEAKTKALGVSPVILKEYGAVSAQTVRAMAAGILTLSGADFSAAVSGIAGPGGGSPGKPVGTVWIGLASKNGTREEKLLSLKGTRRQIRETATAGVLVALRRFAEEQNKVLP